MKLCQTSMKESTQEREKKNKQRARTKIHASKHAKRGMPHIGKGTIK